MIRLAISVEGPTEEAFSKADSYHAPAVAWHRSATHSTWACTWTAVPMAATLAWGGSHRKWRICYRSFDVVTSLVDFYGFRGNRDKTAEELEALVRRKIQQKIDWNQNRVLPYVQKYEFEGLLFSDVTAFSALVDAPPKSVDLLRNIRSGFATPEDINDDWATAPSRRIKGVIRRYRKRLHGPLVAMEIGLEAIRAECPRFNEWVIGLESLQGRI